MGERKVVVVGYDGAGMIDIACVVTPLVMANVIGRLTVPYRVVVVSPGGRAIDCPTGMSLSAQEPLQKVIGPLDTLVVAGGVGNLWNPLGPASARIAEDPALVGHVRRLARESRRVASVCTGAGILAAAGLLDGRRVTTHWRFADELAARHPAVIVDPAPIYIQDGRVWTAAGMTSALDLVLAFVQADHGAELARTVSRELVTYLQRPGNQAQMSIFTSAPPAGDPVMRELVEHISSHLDGDLTATALARQAGVSVRHLTRLFDQHLGDTPGRYVRVARLEAAAQLLTTTSLTMPRVAARCGLGSAESLRRAFTGRYGMSPAAYRTAQRSNGRSRARASL
ncbi:GlxA family transcriptional regulator [Spirillospora sp. NPDC047279]|uniref:GlxA family transcriptional regulator n=1 Tax=Spirillospora sp. NPDC047279 TaxID=3155478 RepID=UPI0033EF83BE